MVNNQTMRNKQVSSRGYNDVKQSDTGTATPLFDCLSQSWTKHSNYSVDKYLRRMVFVCSDCNYTGGVLATDVATHFERVKEDSYNHKTAQIKDHPSDRGGLIFSCTGCSQKFNTRMKADNHISSKLNDGKVHVNPTILDLKQYSLEPRPSHLSEVDDHNSVDSTSSSRSRRRKRNRGRKR